MSTYRAGIEFSKVWAAITDMPLPKDELPVNCEIKVPGISYELKANWIQLRAKNGNRMYIARQKVVRQIDLSGFGKGLVGTSSPTKKNGAVEAHVDLSHPDAEKHITMLLHAMPGLEPTKRERSAPFVASPRRKASSPKDGASSPTPKLDAAAAHEKLKRLFVFCIQAGRPASQETIEKYARDGANVQKALEELAAQNLDLNCLKLTKEPEAPAEEETVEGDEELSAE